MVWANIFYGACWVTVFLVIWFKTDFITNYCQLFNTFKKFQSNYSKFIIKNPELYFPDYLYSLTLKKKSNVFAFIGKLAVCPFCLGFWLSVVAATIFGTGLLGFAPIYIISLLGFLQIKKLM